MKSLYLECNAGISGDMLVAALLDLGADKEALDKALQSIPAKGFEYKISRVSKAGVDCCDFDVILDEEHANHDHDMAFLHGNGDAVVHSHEYEHHHDHEHEHEHEHHHDHEHEHEHEHSHVPHEHHHHEHRGLQEVIAIIDATDMSAAAKALALKIFDIIADAEAKAHAVEKNAVHFHEVGTIDSIVDIVAIAVCADSLGVENVIVPELCEGRGTVRCQHGVLPVPVPATANIMQRFGFNVRLLPVQGEFVTPTGAAAAAALMTTDELPQSFKILGIGLGAGKRQYERPSILRALLIEDNAQKKNSLNNCLQTDCVCKLETDIDDCSGELLGYTLERLLAAGALDAHYQPVFMKKSRPAWELTVICREEDRAKLEALIFAETTTIGIRRARMERTVLPRRRDVVHTAYGDVAVKRCLLDSGERCYVEYDSAAKLAQEQGVPLQDIYLAAQLTQKNIN